MFNLLRIMCICCVYSLISTNTLTTAVSQRSFNNHSQDSQLLVPDQLNVLHHILAAPEKMVINLKLANDSAKRDHIKSHERAAPCYSIGFKYSHGEKVPRLDPCEVCLCMNSEIFCWWEKCVTIHQHQPTFSKTGATMNNKILMHSHKSATPLRPIMIQQTNGNVIDKVKKSKRMFRSKKQFDMGSEHRKKMWGKPALPNEQRFLFKSKSKQTLNKSYKVNKENHKNTQQQKSQQKNVKLNSITPLLTAHFNLDSTSLSPLYKHSNKILKFPENLPSILYYDYKTEEHHYHQNQHHQKHLIQQHQKLFNEKQYSHQQHQHQQPIQIPKHKHENFVNEHLRGSTVGTMQKVSTPIKHATQSAITTFSPYKNGPKDSSYIRNVNENSDGDNENLTVNNLTPIKNKNIVSSVVSGGRPFLSSTSLPLSTMSTLQRTNNDFHNNNMNKSINNVDETTLASTKLNNIGAKLDSNEDEDDAFHRWLISSETKPNQYDEYYDEQEAINSTNNLEDEINSFQHNTSTLFNDYSNEFNGSIVNIDITVTADEVATNKEELTEVYDTNNNEKGDLTDGEQRPIQNPESTLPINTFDEKEVNLILNKKKSFKSLISSDLNKLKLSSLPTGTALMKRILPKIPKSAEIHINKQCNVMGTRYNIGDVLPQDTGNCLQCICIDGSTADDTPRVTCSPHNCPPLVLPDLLDATGY